MKTQGGGGGRTLAGPSVLQNWSVKKEIERERVGKDTDPTRADANRGNLPQEGAG